MAAKTSGRDHIRLGSEEVLELLAQKTRIIEALSGVVSALAGFPGERGGGGHQPLYDVDMDLNRTDAEIEILEGQLHTAQVSGKPGEAKEIEASLAPLYEKRGRLYSESKKEREQFAKAVGELDLSEMYGKEWAINKARP